MYLLHGKLINFTRNPYLSITGQLLVCVSVCGAHLLLPGSLLRSLHPVFARGNIIEISEYCDGGKYNYGGL